MISDKQKEHRRSVQGTWNHHSNPFSTEHGSRIQRFQAFLESRGCTVRRNDRNVNDEIRWLD